VLKCKVKFD